MVYVTVTVFKYLYSRTLGPPDVVKFGSIPTINAVPMYYEGKVVKLKFAILPHKCVLSSRRIWLEKAYRSVEKYSGYGDNRNYHRITYTHWIDKNEYIKWTLMQ